LTFIGVSKALPLCRLSISHSQYFSLKKTYQELNSYAVSDKIEDFISRIINVLPNLERNNFFLEFGGYGKDLAANSGHDYLTLQTSVNEAHEQLLSQVRQHVLYNILLHSISTDEKLIFATLLFLSFPEDFGVPASLLNVDEFELLGEEVLRMREQIKGLVNGNEDNNHCSCSRYRVNIL
jgi:hypothetical protein